MDYQTPPVILIGMHRSGTTLVGSLLQRLGLHLGWMQQENWEALFFLERNEQLMQVCGGGWESPDVLQSLLRYPEMRRQAIELIRRDMESWRFLSYLGPRYLWKGRGPGVLTSPWGWKDPRNSFLLPLWLDLFPDARIIHIYRHPMDVARSLSTREGRRAKRQVSRLAGESVTEDARKRGLGIRHEKGLLRWYRRLWSVPQVLSPLRRYEKLRVSATVSLEDGLRLWTEYVRECCAHVDRMPEQSMSVKYEDFLANPVPHLQSLRDFCGLSAGEDEVKSLCSVIRADRRYAYLEDDESRQVFEPHKEDEWVKRLGYDCD